MLQLQLGLPNPVNRKSLIIAMFEIMSENIAIKNVKQRK